MKLQAIQELQLVESLAEGRQKVSETIYVREQKPQDKAD